MGDLPSGTVTFLFTDIEGNTARWERNRVAMAQGVARHLVLLDAAIQHHGGVHFKTVGDAVSAAFPTALQAVAADGPNHLDMSRLGLLVVEEEEIPLPSATEG
jgi:class 3 adenylate cyclase